MYMEDRQCVLLTAFQRHYVFSYWTANFSLTPAPHRGVIHLPPLAFVSPSLSFSMAMRFREKFFTETTETMVLKSEIRDFITTGAPPSLLLTTTTRASASPYLDQTESTATINPTVFLGNPNRMNNIVE